MAKASIVDRILGRGNAAPLDAPPAFAPPIKTAAPVATDPVVPPSVTVPVTTLPKGYALERSVNYTVKDKAGVVASVQVAPHGNLSIVGDIAYRDGKIAGMDRQLYGQIRHDLGAPVAPQRLVQPGQRVILTNQSTLPVPGVKPPGTVSKVGLFAAVAQGAHAYSEDRAHGQSVIQSIRDGVSAAAPAAAILALPKLQKAGAAMGHFPGRVLEGSAKLVGRVAGPALIFTGARDGAREDADHQRGAVRGAIRSVDPTGIISAVTGNGMGVGERLYNRAFGAPNVPAMANAKPANQGAFINDAARKRADAPSSDDAPMAPNWAPHRSPASDKSENGRSSYATVDGRTVDATTAQARAWTARRKD